MKSKAHPVYLQAARGGYVAPKDLSTLIRDALRRAFPGSAFSVTTKRGTGSVNVRWQDGPAGKAVETVAGAFETKGFDGMIDLAHSNSLWIYPDGSAHLAHDAGTGGSMGSVPEMIESPRRPDAVLLDNVAACFVFCQRTVTARAYRQALAEFRAQNWVGCEGVDWSALEIVTSDYDGSAHLNNCPNIQPGNGCRWLSDELSSLAYSYDLTAPDAEPEPVATILAPAPAIPEHAPVLCW